MASPTARLGLRVLEGSDAADVPADLNQVTGILDHAAIDGGQGGFGGIPSPGLQGKTYWVNDRKQLFRDNGASWDVVGEGPVPWVASLPASPFDGMVIDYVANNTGGVIWRFRYRSSASGSYKWQFVGGPPLEHAVAADQGTASTSYVDLTGPELMVPLTGEYVVSWGASSYNSGTSSNLAALRIGGSVSDANAAQVDAAAANKLGTHMRVLSRVAITAGTFAEIYYRVSGGTGQFRHRWLTVTPIRVG